MIEKINIRATALQEFWGTEYNDDIYLWEGSKLNLTLTKISNLKEKTFIDQFSSVDAINSAMINCKDIYHKYLPILTKQLNNYHNLNLSNEFWQIAFGYWFYRHICVVFEKYAYLSKIDIDNSSIKLLSKDAYHVPFNHDEYYTFFGFDRGVQQLVSEYYSLFASKSFEQITPQLNQEARKEKSTISPKKGLKTLQNLKAPSSFKVFLRKVIQPKVVLVDTYYKMNHISKLILKSFGKILPIDIPEVENSTKIIDRIAREKIFHFEVSDTFEKYLIKSFAYSVPTIFVENFKKHYDVYLNDIKKSSYSTIVCEGWIGLNNYGIYSAVANEEKKTLVFQEHAFSSGIVDRSFQWFYLSFAQQLITTGWFLNDKKVIKGGFLAKILPKYTFRKDQSTILFAGHTSTPYLMEFSWHPSNSNFVNELFIIKHIFEILPPQLLTFFKFRPRRSSTNLDTEYLLELNSDNPNVDRGDFHESIKNSRIVILDHLSTGLAELLIIGIPFIVLVNRHTNFTADAQPFIDEMTKIGIVHYSPESLVNKLTEVYDNTEYWWKSNEVQSTINKFKTHFVGTPSNTYNFLISQLKN